MQSLHIQIFPNWRIIARDDGSTDTSVDKVRFSAHADARITLTSGSHVGIAQSMQSLLSASSAPYFMPADQDDIWLPQKIDVLMSAIRTLEAAYGPDCPLLVYCDVELVNEQGTRLHRTLRQALHLPEDWGETFWQLLLMSPSPGCAMLGNAALRNAALPLPASEAMFMYDWWLLLCAAALGHVVRVPLPLVHYRQHSGNALGATPRCASLFQRMSVSRANIRKTWIQAATLLARHGSSMRETDRKWCEAWANMPSLGRFERLAVCRQHGFFKPGRLRNLFFLALICTDTQF